MKIILLTLIKFYRAALSPYLQPSCRYTPTCSLYAYEAIQKYGSFRGTLMAIKRISRCHPLHKGGHDPVS